MDINQMPEDSISQIIRYLPFKDRVRIGLVSKRFRQLSKAEISATKYLDFGEWYFEEIKSDQMEILLNSCKISLQVLKFNKFGDHKDVALVKAFSELTYTFPKVIEFETGYCDEDVIRRVPNIRSFTSRFKGCFLFPTDLILENLERLVLSSMNDASLRSLVGQAPNLKHFETDLSSTKNTLDNFFASTPKLEVLELASLKIVEQFWNLSALKSLTLKYNSMDNQQFQRISTSFPNLENLNFERYTANSEGIAALASLTNLRLITLSHYADEGRLAADDRIKRFSNCRQLSEFKIYHLPLTPATFIALIRGCPDLKKIRISHISNIETPEMASAMLDSFFDIGKRNVEVGIYGRHFEEIWESQEVKMTLEHLKEDGGPVINFRHIVMYKEHSVFRW